MQLTGALSRVLVSHTMRKRAVTIAKCIFAALVCASVFATSTRAQALRGMRGEPRFAPAHRAARSYAFPAYWADYSSGYTESPAIENAPPEIIELVQPAQPAPPPAPPAEPLILEVQGDHWVRVFTGSQSQPADATAATPEPVSSVAVASANQAAAPAAQLPPAVLVFRDGHQEEISKYTIVGSAIITNADYWTTGAWTQKIEIADLDVPETLRLNQQRGAQFKLPSSPSEVIVRP
jgi:hypothetical protein